jgi:hypothetical protein
MDEEFAATQGGDDPALDSAGALPQALRGRIQ